MKQKSIKNSTVYSRFSDAPWMDVVEDVSIYGVGGIGSNLAYAMGRLGIKLIHLIDDDLVEEHNLGSQMFRLTDISTPKVFAAENLISKFNNTSSVICYKDRITKDNAYKVFRKAAATFSCFDNINSRKLLFDQWLKDVYSNRDNYYYKLNPIFIDGRMEAEYFQIYAVYNDESIDLYKNSLFDEESVEDLPCNFKSTVHTSMLIAGMMTAILMNYAANQSTKNNSRSVPYKTEFIVPILNLNAI